MWRAYCTPRWPNPPTPNTATKSPALAGEFRSALKVVMPAQSRGAASTDDSSSGTAIRLHPGEALVYAVHEVAIAAVHTVPAAAAEEADADALAHRPTFDAFANHIDSSHRLVARHPRPLDRQYSLHRRGIRMAHATGLDAYADMARRRLEQRLYGQLQLAWTHCLDCTIRGHRFCHLLLRRFAFC